MLNTMYAFFIKTRFKLKKPAFRNGGLIYTSMEKIKVGFIWRMEKTTNEKYRNIGVLLVYLTVINDRSQRSITWNYFIIIMLTLMTRSDT